MITLPLKKLLSRRRVTLLQRLATFMVKDRNVKISLSKAQIDDRYLFAKQR